MNGIMNQNQWTIVEAYETIKPSITKKTPYLMIVIEIVITNIFIHLNIHVFIILNLQILVIIK